MIQSRDDRENTPLPAPVVAVAEVSLQEGGETVATQSAGSVVSADNNTPAQSVVLPYQGARSTPIYGKAVAVETPAPAAPVQTAALPPQSAPLAQPGTSESPTWHLAPVPEPDGTVYQGAVQDTSIFVQAGAFVEKRNADRLQRRMLVLGKPTSVSQSLVGNRLFYRVRLGPIDSVDEADQLLNVLLSNGIDGAKVVVD